MLSSMWRPSAVGNLTLGVAQMRGAVAPGCLELQHHLAGGVGLYALVGQSWAGDVAAQLLQRLAVIRPAAHCGVQAETLHVGAQRLIEVRIPGHDALHRQHLLPGSWAKSDAIGTRRGLQEPERAGEAASPRRR